MIFAANWKMNLANEAAKDLVQQYITAAFDQKHKVIVLPSLPAIEPLAKMLSATANIEVYAQDVSKFPGFGNFTGETSASQIKDAGASGCLIGHMERRTHLQETDEDINSKIKNALAAGLKVILSVGETTAGLTVMEAKSLIDQQLLTDLRGITDEMIAAKITIAFETVATISSFGNQQVGDALPVAEIMAKLGNIKTWLGERFPDVNVPIIYGGSIAPTNISQFVTNAGVSFEGFLVGKKSLDVTEFKKLLQSV